MLTFTLAVWLSDQVLPWGQESRVGDWLATGSCDRTVRLWNSTMPPALGPNPADTGPAQLPAHPRPLSSGDARPGVTAAWKRKTRRSRSVTVRITRSRSGVLTARR